MSGRENVRGVVDLVFLLDITGSMQHCIEALKENIAGFMDLITTKGANNENPVKHWRGKVVGYRDFNYDKDPIVDAPFVEDATALRAQLSTLKASGGGDEPESLLEALYFVSTMEQTPKGAQTLDPHKWRYRSDAARVVVVFTDATYHPIMQKPSGGTISDLTNVMHSNRIVLSLFAPDMECHDKLSEIDKSEYTPIPWDKKMENGPQRALAEFTANRESFSKTLQMLAKSITQSANIEAL